MKRFFQTVWTTLLDPDRVLTAVTAGVRSKEKPTVPEESWPGDQMDSLVFIPVCGSWAGCHFAFLGQHRVFTCAEPKAWHIQRRISRPYSRLSPFTFTYPLTAEVVEALQMTSQPVSHAFPCSSMPSGSWLTPGLSTP